MTIIEKKITKKYGNRYKASKELELPYYTLTYWCKNDPKGFGLKLIKKIAKALNEDVDKLRLEILND